MKKKVNLKSSLLETPTEMVDFPSSSPNESPKSPLFTIINDNKKKSTVSTSKNKKTDKPQPTIAAVKNLGTISDLKDLVSSRLDHLKRHIEHSHSEIIKDLQASHSRLHKRFKIQTQACQQAMDEAEKEYKKMSERVSESREAMQHAKHQSLSFQNPVRKQLIIFKVVLGFHQLSHLELIFERMSLDSRGSTVYYN
ncbi:hypothetical protein CFP56_004517 [Quercus suber]|uniref:Uncharacterized protein n=1 Tax=Quercus suber TaxID=58331 RepID=A0AAW0LC77_QUESU